MNLGAPINGNLNQQEGIRTRFIWTASTPRYWSEDRDPRRFGKA